MSNRDVTNFINNNTEGESNTLEEKFNSNPITFVPQTQRFITIQKKESVQVWQFNTAYNDGQGFIDYNFEDIFTRVWEYQSDEISNQVLDILVDTMPKGKVDFYLL